MVAKYLDDKKTTNSHCFKHRRSYSVSINLLNIAKFPGVESKSTVPKFRKRARKFLFCVHQLHKRAREIKKFHAGRKRACCCFANITGGVFFYFIYFLRSRNCFRRGVTKQSNAVTSNE